MWRHLIERRQMGSEGRIPARRRFSLERMARRAEMVFLRLAGGIAWGGAG